jgi:hypothetical protein
MQQALAHVRRHAHQTVRRHMSTSLHSKALNLRVSNQKLVQDKAFINGEFVTGSNFGSASATFSETSQHYTLHPKAHATHSKDPCEIPHLCMYFITILWHQPVFALLISKRVLFIMETRTAETHTQPLFNLQVKQTTRDEQRSFSLNQPRRNL